VLSADAGQLTLNAPELRSYPLTMRPLAVRALVVVGSAVAAYYYSLSTLIRGLTLDSPLAYLGLVPFIAIGLVIARGLAPRSEPDIHDRHVDYIIGLPLIILALVFVLILPVHQSTFFWLWRLDLFSMPFFVAGALCVVFGVRVLWRLRFPVAFLFLAWPLPFSTVLNGVLNWFTEVTTKSLTFLTRILPLAQPAPGSDGSIFAVSHGAQTFMVAIASACTGVNGVIGFLLIGLAFGFLVHGHLLTKSMWLIGGMLLVWLLNIARVLLIFAVGRQWGESVAIDWIHPVVGLGFFNLGVLAMLLAMPRFGLRFGTDRPRSPEATESLLPTLRRPHLAVARAGTACIVVLLAGVVGMVANSGLAEYELLAQDIGTPRLADLSVADASISGWSLGQVDSYTWAQQYFGPQSSWIRYEYDWQSQTATASTFQSSQPVVMDVISTTDLSSLSTYGLEACYQFHNYHVMDARTVDLAGGVTGHALTYHNPSINSDWIAVYWEWPVLGSGGYRYERVILNLLNPSGEHLVAPPLTANLSTGSRLAVNDWLLGSSQERLSREMTSARDFLIEFGQQVITSAAAHQAQA
jgi:exosortase/archaeosortase family protein